MTLLAISAIICFAYIAYCLFKYDLTKSISITYYKHDKPDRWLFIAFMVSFSFLFALAANGWLFWVAMGFAWITAAAANSRKNEFLRWTHVIASILMIVSAAAGLGWHYGLWELVIVGALGTGTVFIPKVYSHTWLIEVWWIIIVFFGDYIDKLLR